MDVVVDELWTVDEPPPLPSLRTRLIHRPELVHHHVHRRYPRAIADAVSVNAGIYLVMGANIGTSATNTIVAMGQMGSDDQLERAFSNATVHDLFNLLAVAVLFPLEHWLPPPHHGGHAPR